MTTECDASHVHAKICDIIAVRVIRVGGGNRDDGAAFADQGSPLGGGHDVRVPGVPPPAIMDGD